MAKATREYVESILEESDWRLDTAIYKLAGRTTQKIYSDGWVGLYETIQRNNEAVRLMVECHREHEDSQSRKVDTSRAFATEGLRLKEMINEFRRK